MSPPKLPLGASAGAMGTTITTINSGVQHVTGYPAAKLAAAPTIISKLAEAATRASSAAASMDDVGTAAVSLAGMAVLLMAAWAAARRYIPASHGTNSGLGLGSGNSGRGKSTSLGTAIGLGMPAGFSGGRLATLWPWPTSQQAVRTLFVWHAFDALVHLIVEGGFLWHCIFSHTPASAAVNGAKAPPPGYLGAALAVPPEARLYYGPVAALAQLNSHDPTPGVVARVMRPLAHMWMVYAQADRRWGGVDVTVISIELLTVLIVAPLACYVCYLLAKRDPRAYFWMIIVATAELYGGFMTFCPEWLTSNAHLDASSFMHLWVYLVFFNMLWVVFPVYSIYVSWHAIGSAFIDAGLRKTR